MNNITTFDIISDLISLINSEEFDATIPTLSKYCNIPIEYTRRFILHAMSNNILSACISGEDIESSDLDYSVIEEYLDDEELFSEKLLSGKYDHIIWTIDLKVLPPAEDQLIGLSPLELSAIQNLGESKMSFKHGGIYERKDNTSTVDKSIRKNQEVIQTAIQNHSKISFSYKNRDGRVESHEGFPINISTNVVDNWIYFELANNYNYRLDRVTSTIKLINDGQPFPIINDNPKKKYMWGSFFNESSEPEHVKLVITDITTNIIQKIENDTQHRKGICHFYKKGEFYYYEDYIIGISEFQRWLRGYGSSIQVIEPLYLREKMIDSAKTALDYYTKSNLWKDL
ncbi:WYL domain-containing protein [Butyrivibrio hungatei DSM 14810]|uniref:WYL domain-containing protein n=1 Tax=Butyrivibrio hungatei DSM 14810 TaxID=1121132 RepID=A0A1M7T1G7_9FIRM|nr:WYL domain-containing protein [Butyrivibrio hungatei]SHN64593.1 WYL domain-containing protein [Butyrivibrio hungatei DSM 14810]